MKRFLFDDSANGQSNVDGKANLFKSGQDDDGVSAKGPNEWLAIKFEEMHGLYQGVQGKSPFAIRQYQQGL